MLFLLLLMMYVLQTRMTTSSLLLSYILRGRLHRIIVIYSSPGDSLSFSSINRQSRNMILPLSFPRDWFITFSVFSYEKLQRVLNMVKLENLDLMISMRWEPLYTDRSIHSTTTMKLISSCPNVRSLRFDHHGSDTLLFLTGYHCHDLIQIDLSGCGDDITDIGVMYLISECPNLTGVDLSETAITDDSIIHLTTCCHNKLRSLGLAGCIMITDKSILELWRFSCLIEVNLKHLHYDDAISDCYKKMFLRYDHRFEIVMNRYELERHDFIDSKGMNMINFTVT